MASGTLRILASAMLATATVASLSAPPASADGLPVLGLASGNHAIRSLDGRFTYSARPTGRGTTVGVISSRDRSRLSATLPGRYAVPVVAYDGAAAGLSANGRTLVLIRPRVRFPQTHTALAILDARTLRVQRYVRLNGDFSIDALSPNGRWIYLIQYTSRNDPTRYRVRALDSGSGRMLNREIVDPRQPDESMRGNPLARVNGAGGRWAYTLYDGNGHPFIHALDTAGLQARCIDLPVFPANSNWFDARVVAQPGDRRLLVTLGGRTLAALDTATLTVSVPGRAAHRVSPKPAQRGSAGTLGIGFPIAIGILLLGGGLLALRRRLATTAKPSGGPA